MAGDKHSSADKQQAGGQKRKQPLLPFARLVVGDELGLLKGECARGQQGAAAMH